MPNQNQDDTRRGDQSTQNRPNQGQQGLKDRQGQPARPEGQRDDQRQAGNQRGAGEPEIGEPIPQDKRRPRDRLPVDDNVDEETRQADNEDVERERDRPNPRLQ